MNRVKNYMNQLRKEVEEYKVISHKKLQEADEIIEELISIIKELSLEDKLDLFYYEGYHFTWRGTSKTDDRLVLANKDGYVFNPRHIGESYYIKGDLHGYVRHMNTIEVIEVIQKLPDFVKNFFKVIKEYYKQWEIDNKELDSLMKEGLDKTDFEDYNINITKNKKRR